jgi:FixJ family two-component response regulator
VIPREFTVAVVDDDPRVLESLQELLQSVGHTVHLFEDAQSLLAAKAFQEIDCLISDIGMPAIDGFELGRLARNARPGLPVILITGRRELIEGRAPDPNDHAQTYLLKPFSERALLTAISDMVAGGVSASTPHPNGRTL